LAVGNKKVQVPDYNLGQSFGGKRTLFMGVHAQTLTKKKKKEKGGKWGRTCTKKNYSRLGTIRSWGQLYEMGNQQRLVGVTAKLARKGAKREWEEVVINRVWGEGTEGGL